MKEKIALKKVLKEKGVTLVALVVTIVVLLILAGVSIAMLSGDNGLITQTKNASEEWKIAQDKEQLELAKQTEIAKGKGYIDVDDYFQRLEDEGIVNDKDADIVDNGDGSYDVTTGNGNTFEVTPIPDKENAEDIEIDYVGQGEIVGPRINKIDVTEKTETSISIEVVTRNAEGGNYTYSYKKATDSNYTQVQTTTNNTYTFTNLEENTEYNIKVKVETAEGSIEKEITVKTKAEETEEPDPPEEEVPEGTITFGTATWSGGKASIQLSTTSKYQMEYQINGTEEGKWTSIVNNGIIQNIPYNATVNVRLVNGSKRGQVQSTTIQDTNKPSVTVSKQGNATTNTITVNVQSIDNESGMIANPTYTYYIKKTSENTYQQKASNQASSYTFTGLEQETSYDIKVEVQGDNAGNKGEGTLTNITTGKVTEGTEQGAITFGNPAWEGDNASVTVSTNTNFQIEYQVNTVTEGNWTKIENNGTIPNLKNGDTVYARLTDGTNYGEHASMTLKNENPVINTFARNGKTPSTLSFSVEATDPEGQPMTYKLYVGGELKQTLNEQTSGNTVTITASELSNYTEYNDCYVIVEDPAGGTVTSSKLTEKTQCSGATMTCDKGYVETIQYYWCDVCNKLCGKYPETAHWHCKIHNRIYYDFEYSCITCNYTEGTCYDFEWDSPHNVSIARDCGEFTCAICKKNYGRNECKGGCGAYICANCGYYVIVCDTCSNDNWDWDRDGTVTSHLKYCTTKGFFGDEGHVENQKTEHPCEHGKTSEHSYCEHSYEGIPHD